jgi:hypothetical protein
MAALSAHLAALTAPLASQLHARRVPEGFGAVAVLQAPEGGHFTHMPRVTRVSPQGREPHFAAFPGCAVHHIWWDSGGPDK